MLILPFRLVGGCVKGLLRVFSHFSKRKRTMRNQTSICGRLRALQPKLSKSSNFWRKMPHFFSFFNSFYLWLGSLMLLYGKVFYSSFLVHVSLLPLHYNNDDNSEKKCNLFTTLVSEVSTAKWNDDFSLIHDKTKKIIASSGIPSSTPSEKKEPKPVASTSPSKDDTPASAPSENKETKLADSASSPSPSKDGASPSSPSAYSSEYSFFDDSDDEADKTKRTPIIQPKNSSSSSNPIPPTSSSPPPSSSPTFPAPPPPSPSPSSPPPPPPPSAGPPPPPPPGPSGSADPETKAIRLKVSRWCGCGCRWEKFAQKVINPVSPLKILNNNCNSLSIGVRSQKERLRILFGWLLLMGLSCLLPVCLLRLAICFFVCCPSVFIFKCNYSSIKPSQEIQKLFPASRPKQIKKKNTPKVPLIFIGS